MPAVQRELPHGSPAEPNELVDVAKSTNARLRMGSAFMDYDEVHHLLYTSNYQGGLFRMVTR